MCVCVCVCVCVCDIGAGFTNICDPDTDSHKIIAVSIIQFSRTQSSFLQNPIYSLALSNRNILWMKMRFL